VNEEIINVCWSCGLGLEISGKMKEYTRDVDGDGRCWWMDADEIGNGEKRMVTMTT
jgi:hypothetical protein